MPNKIELLSPVGSPEALRAAVVCGADAVYLGVPIFNARQSAQNFELQQLKEAVTYAHRRGVFVYLTLNTLISDKETKEFLDILKTVNEFGIDDEFVQDRGRPALIKAEVPE
jgi:putative protease